MLETISDLAYNSLIEEAKLSPKPGLVDQFDNGSHKDMNFSTFLISAESLRPYFNKYLLLGEKYNGSPSELFKEIRYIGIEAEQAMYAATGGINTHKGANFLFGIILSAIAYGNYPDLINLISLIKEMTYGLVNKELENLNEYTTFGEIVYKRYSITGIRGEVEQGLPLVTNFSLPIMFEPNSLEVNMKKALLSLISNNDDTNMLKRGGIDGLNLGKEMASQKYHSQDEHLSHMNEVFVSLNLSPGGSADLLAVTLFLYSYIKFNDNDNSQ